MTITVSFPSAPVSNTLTTYQQSVANSESPNSVSTTVTSQGGQIKYDGNTGQGPLATKGFPILLTLTPSAVAPVEFVGAGLNDATSGGTVAAIGDVFYVEIQTAATPDTFKWRKNGGAFTSGVAMTGSPQTLSDGVTIDFAATTGHTVGNNWAIRMLGDGTLDLTALDNGDITQDMTGLAMMELSAIAHDDNTHEFLIQPGASNGYDGWVGDDGLILNTGKDQNKLGPLFGCIDVDGTHKTIDYSGTGTESVYLSLLFG